MSADSLLRCCLSIVLFLANMLEIVSADVVCLDASEMNLIFLPFLSHVVDLHEPPSAARHWTCPIDVTRSFVDVVYPRSDSVAEPIPSWRQRIHLRTIWSGVLVQ